MFVYRVERRYSTFVPASYWPDGSLRRPMRKTTSVGPYRWRDVDVTEIKNWEHNIGSFPFKHVIGFQEDRHPTVHQDRKLSNTLSRLCDSYENYEFCFSNLDHLKKWFDANDRTALYLNYFYIGVYESKDHHVIEGHTQSLFKLNKSELVDCIFFEDEGLDLSAYDHSDINRYVLNRFESLMNLRNTK